MPKTMQTTVGLDDSSYSRLGNRKWRLRPVDVVKNL